MNIFCKLFGCKQRDCIDEIAREVKVAQEDCNRIIREREEGLRIEIAEMVEAQKRVAQESKEWMEKYFECMKNKPDPKPDKSIKSLEVKDGKFWVNGKETVFIGCSRWEALARAKGIWHGWGTKSLEWYEEQLIKSGINYVRHGIVSDSEFVRQHCIRMGKAGIVVELTIHNSQIKHDMGNPFDAVDTTIDLPNVFYDVHNEFLDREEDIEKAEKLVNYAFGWNGICSAGAWGHSPHGERYSMTFNPINNLNQVVSVHREWSRDWIARYLGHGKPVIRNEYFDRGVLGLEGTKRIMKETVEVGGHCQYYGFRDKSILPDLEHPDPESWDKYLKFAGDYCKERNNRILL